MEEKKETTKALDRDLSPLDVWAMAFGVMVGWGLFAMPGNTFLPVAGPAGTLISMLVGMAIMPIIASSFSYLMGRSSITGGVYSYTKEASGRDHAFLSSRFLCLSYLTIVFLNGTALFYVLRILLDAAAASRPGDYDAVLMDIQMPVMDGYAAARAIRALDERALAEIPIVAMTANAFREDVQASLDAGMQAHVAKPIDVGVLRKTLRSVLKP